jgi:hypothetical protein
MMSKMPWEIEVFLHLWVMTYRPYMAQKVQRCPPEPPSLAYKRRPADFGQTWVPENFGWLQHPEPKDRMRLVL